jgi:hypothetical protein
MGEKLMTDRTDDLYTSFDAGGQTYIRKITKDHIDKAFYMLRRRQKIQMRQDADQAERYRRLIADLRQVNPPAPAPFQPLNQTTLDRLHSGWDVVNWAALID